MRSTEEGQSVVVGQQRRAAWFGIAGRMAVRYVLDSEISCRALLGLGRVRDTSPHGLGGLHHAVVILDNPCQLLSRRGKLLFAGDALALFNGHDLGGSNPREIVAFAIRPAYRYVGCGRCAQTEVHAEVALRDEGTAAADLVNLLVTAGG
jgi:hypothetical protein